MEMVQTAEELYDYFWYCGAFKGRVHTVNVSTKVRKEILTSPQQGKVTVNSGRVEVIQWKNLGGGVWQASVEVKEC